jgi:ketosteroid isomerase-like protein
VIVGPVAGIVMATAAIMPRSLDLAFRPFCSRAGAHLRNLPLPHLRKDTPMTSAVDTVRAFYAALGHGDAPAALGLMADDIEWNTMWRYKVDGRGPQRVAEGLFKPLMAEWSSFALVPTEYIAEGGTVVSLGRFTGVHAVSGKTVDAAYAHVWDVAEGRIQRFRQYIDTLAVADAQR